MMVEVLDKLTLIFVVAAAAVLVVLLVHSLTFEFNPLAKHHTTNRETYTHTNLAAACRFAAFKTTTTTTN